MTPPARGRLRQFTRLSRTNWAVGRRLLPQLRDWAAEIDGAVVDLGCGESPFASLFENCSSYVRADLRLDDGPQLSCSLLHLPLQTASVDCIVLFHVLSDVSQPEDALREAGRALKPGGTVLLLESTCYPEHDLPHDYLRILPQGLRHFAARSGFTDVEIVPLGGLFCRGAQLWNTFVMGRLRTWPLVGLVAPLGIAACNVAAHSLDALAPHPRLAPDYLARLKKHDELGRG